MSAAASRLGVRQRLARLAARATPGRALLGVVAALVLGTAVGVGGPYLRYLRSHETTDDAYVDGTTATVTSRVAGTVVAVDVQNNWTVQRGQRLVTLDPRDFEVKLQEAEAGLEHARQTVDSLYAKYGSAQAALALADEQLGQARLDFERAQKLRKSNVLSQDAYDRASTALRVAEANRAVAAHDLDQARAALGDAPDASRRDDHPLVRQAQAAVEAAKLDLAYTALHAPLDGIIASKHVEIGDRVEAGQPLMTLVPPPRELFVTANFKETQLRDVRVGQAAELRADAYPGQVYHAHVDSISMGTGSAFALLPPENASGNWVKVVQRVPVKLVLDEDPPREKPLRIGLSVEVSIDTEDTRGALLASALQEAAGRQARPTQGASRLPLPAP